MGTGEREPEPPFPFGAVVVPDDASSLEPDRQAWLAEQRAARRRARRRRFVLTRRWERSGLSGPVLALSLALTATVGALAVALVPRPATPPPSAAPLAAVSVANAAADAPAVEPAGGAVVGHRLAPVRLEGDAGSVTASGLRPAVLVLVPPACGCTDAVRAVYRQAREFRLDVWLVATGSGTAEAAARRELVALDEEAAAGGARFGVDTTGALTASLSAHGTTLATIRADGVVTALRRDLPLDPAQLPPLEPVLAELAQPNR